MSEIGRWLVMVGLLLVLMGGLLILFGRIPGLGRLPGDILWRKGNFTLFAPLGTMLLISLILTIALNIIARLFR